MRLSIGCQVIDFMQLPFSEQQERSAGSRFCSYTADSNPEKSNRDNRTA